MRAINLSSRRLVFTQHCRDCRGSATPLRHFHCCICRGRFGSAVGWKGTLTSLLVLSGGRLFSSWFVRVAHAVTLSSTLCGGGTLRPLQALSEQSDLEALRQEKRAIAMEERRLKALLDIEKAKAARAADRQAAARAERQRRQAKVDYRREKVCPLCCC